MRGLNKAMLIGNVGNDPEVRTTASSGVKVAKLSLATSRTFKDGRGKQQEQTQWHRVTCWDKLADIVEQYVKKGDRLYIEGRIEYSTTEDGEGNPRYWTDIIAQELVMLGSPQTAGAGARKRDDDDSDLPF